MFAKIPEAGDDARKVHDQHTQRDRLDGHPRQPCLQGECRNSCSNQSCRVFGQILKIVIPHRTGNKEGKLTWKLALQFKINPRSGFAGQPFRNYLRHCNRQ